MAEVTIQRGTNWDGVLGGQQRTQLEIIRHGRSYYTERGTNWDGVHEGKYCDNVEMLE